MREIKKLDKVTISLKSLKSIASYYEFPFVVFLTGRIFRGTRRKSLHKTLFKFKTKLTDLFDEVLEKI